MGGKIIRLLALIAFFPGAVAHAWFLTPQWKKEVKETRSEWEACENKYRKSLSDYYYQVNSEALKDPDFKKSLVQLKRKRGRSIEIDPQDYPKIPNLSDIDDAFQQCQLRVREKLDDQMDAQAAKGKPKDRKRIVRRLKDDSPYNIMTYDDETGKTEKLRTLAFNDAKKRFADR